MNKVKILICNIINENQVGDKWMNTKLVLWQISIFKEYKWCWIISNKSVSTAKHISINFFFWTLWFAKTIKFFLKI